MKNSVVLLALIFSFSLNAQVDIELIGNYRSQNMSGDSWTLNLLSDSTYTFASDLNNGESMQPGRWFVIGDILWLKYNYKKEEYLEKMKITKSNERLIIKPQTACFRRMKLRKL